ncbi:MAG: hypothetical protein A3E02_02260 [Candidatus Zambryskibacteria bacterium RIFCSPHIGHO2_12_FULL_38_34]|uniref:Hydrolase TatD n=1 Tax=Candidatus Zambryskibacteria bacterium RIFCSPLOWO2_12_FULL_39_16 TaxID=1802775 RepID=A0A1G2US88_9BACT|nr:MAG: hypothetical protein A3D37_01200 [Candidatus Zambryskibacteria bacterium RIFCSPHIGHO2_02_FULL_38_22]OHA97817.1 MAG: hypothetical protein A3E02_02260 [Candidatus Zambryskibacteria bacterium RIFCSPHIGHO2_12_FULL_38_34]OHB08592.1 MAG: hypothetical protein A3I19_00560 [Candidatus Zambryskibacteria bacterium RIFCSPLOWO2_02_FULL_38_13]OHB12249.1 MAG: hypothetical protein A3G46_01345 [Candidatus Zambryskibacteria bacterium RIFCSPLOWO2_12_FULL_39_16]
MKYVDIHCHLDFPDYDSDREGVLARMKENEVGAITIGVDFETSKKAVEIAKQNKNIWACVGQHPENMGDGFDERIEELAREPKVVAIGECGLDYFRLGENSKETKKLQKKLFEAQIDLALEVEKPLMLHIRPGDKIPYDAYFDSLEILESYNKIHGSKLKGNAHFYVGNTEILKRFLDISFTASFSGVVTFTHEYDEAVKFVPLNMIMSETDAPFVAPVPFRGKRNEPAYVVEVVKKLAEIRTENMYVLNDSIVENFKRVFGV